MENTGSFMANAGGMSEELKQAIQRRSGATSTPMGAMTANPSTQPAPAPTAQAPGMSPSVPQGGQPMAATPQVPFDPAEIKMIVGGLTNRLKSISKLQGA